MTHTPTLPRSVLATRRLSGWLSLLGVSPMAFDDTVGLINPLMRVHQLQARVVDKRSETPSAVTLVLQTGPAFPALRAGQYVVIGVTIQGVRHRRAYSPRALPGAPGQIAITVQRQPGGRVSTHIQENVRPGDLIDIEAPAGDFTLPTPLPGKVLLIAGGSGITPCMAMLQHLRKHASATQVTLLYFARSPRDRIFGAELAEMASRWTSLRYLPHDHTQGARGLDLALLQEQVPDWLSQPAFCCGPAPLMDTARALWRDTGVASHLHLEAFTAPQASGDPLARHAITVRRDAQVRQFEAPGNLTLLVAGEQAGVALKHGCRQGLCHECTCRLQRGSVQDLSTGQRVEGEGQPIRLCISAALSDLDLESLN